MSTVPEVGHLLALLCGTWHGHGEGSYPTLEPFTFREVTTMTRRADHPALHYEQRTWAISGDTETASHWETGLIRLHSDGTVRTINAQGGRAEVLEGTFEPVDGGWEIRLAAAVYAGDDRVLASSRSYLVTPGTLTYRMSMATNLVPELTHHIGAELRKAQD